MRYRTLLAILQSEADAARVLDLAVPLAAKQGSHLIGLHAEALPIAVATPMGGPAVDLTTGADETVRARLAEMRRFFNERTRAQSVSFEWRGIENLTGDSAISGLESARAADLVIAQQVDPDAAGSQVCNVESLLFESGRPVLFVPYARSVTEPHFKKVIVAWNGSKEAARAAFDALIFLKDAEAVEVLAVDPDETGHRDSGMAGAEIATALSRHDVRVTYRAETSDGVPTGEVIENRVGESGADLLVMGAYGHSRLREFIFGGTTRTMLQSMPVPTFMSR